jgi:hypothetical protein
MNEPLGVPGGFKGSCRSFTDQTQKKGTPKVAKGAWFV